LSKSSNGSSTNNISRNVSLTAIAQEADEIVQVPTVEDVSIRVFETTIYLFLEF
jgi:hypothetical protein